VPPAWTPSGTWLAVKRARLEIPTRSLSQHTERRAKLSVRAINCVEFYLVQFRRLLQFLSKICVRAIFALETDNEVTVKLNGKKAKAKMTFAQPTDLGFAKTWQESIGDNQNPVRTDAVEFAMLAIKRFEASAGLGIYANSLVDFSDRVASNPKV
jgi:hypothetical protein